MSTDWERLEHLFAEAIEVAPQARPAFLDDHCAGRPELRAEIESLLQAHEQAETSFTARSAAVRDILGSLGGGFLTGKRLGVYQMENIVAEGGMGIVYRALDTRANTPVAVKVLPHELSLDSPWRRRFSREVRATAAIRHPNVVRILDHGEDSGSLYLVMELIEGQSLRAALAKGALPLEKVLDYGIQIAAALEAAHAAGVIHHDLKPGNIMVTPEEQLKVVDFGLSRFQDDSGPDSSRSRLSQVGTPAGTIDYLSPEQAGGRPVDTRSDLFAMGSVLYEMLSGRRAFHRATNLETAAAILRDRPERLPESVPAPVERLVEKCLAKDAGKRVQSAGELREKLEGLCEKLRQGKLKPQRFRRTRRIAVWALPAAALAVALLVFGMSGNRTPVNPALRFQRLTDDPHVTTEPALSLDGRWLAYASDRAEDGNVDIWIQGTGQANARRLTNHPAVDHEPTLSPDGSLLAFRSEREPAGIYLMAVEDTGKTPAARPPALQGAGATGGHERLVAAGGRRPQFSPDGKWIAYWSGPEVNGDASAILNSAIFVIPSAGGTPRRLAENFGEARYPVWSPDSGSVLFSGHREINSDDSELWTAPLDGGALRLKARWKYGAWNSMTPATPFAWPRKDLLFLRWVALGTNPHATHIWRMRFPNRPESEAPVPEQVTSGLGPYTWCTADRSGRIIVAGGPRRSAIWSLPIVADTADLRGGMSPLALEGERESLSSMTADGKQMLFESQDPRGLERWILRNLDSGQETVLESGSLTGPMLIAPGGKWLSAMKHAFLSQRQMLPPGLQIREFKNQQIMWDLSRDGSLCLSAGYSRHRSVELDRSLTNDSVVLLEHPDFNLYLAYFSADGRWIVVTAENGHEPPRLFAVPFRPPYPIPVSSWVDLGEGSFGRWAPSGSRIYFLRDHQGARCIFTRALDPVTKRPVGDATAVLHLHSAWRSPLQLDPGYFRLVVAPGRLVFPLGEGQSNLWLAE